MSTDNDTAAHSRPADVIGQMIDVARADGAENVVVAGQAQLDLLVGLWHRGFARVTCRAADGGPCGGEPPADLLFVPACRSEASLRAVLTRLGRALRPGGTLVVQGDCPAMEALRLRRLLGEGGFDTIEQRTASPDAGFVLAARKRAAALRARAA